jgi:hypothetical protein
MTRIDADFVSGARHLRSSEKSAVPFTRKRRGDWGQTNRLENPGLGAIFPACSRGDGWGAPTGLRSRGGNHPGRCPGLFYFAPLGLGIVRRPSQAVYGSAQRSQAQWRLGMEIGDRQPDSKTRNGARSSRPVRGAMVGTPLQGFARGERSPGALPRAVLFRPVGAGNRPATVAGRLWERPTISGPTTTGPTITSPTITGHGFSDPPWAGSAATKRLSWV